MKKFLLLIIVLIMYVSTSELSAKRKAEKFCDSVSIGQSTENLLDLGIEAGARANSTQWYETKNRTRQLSVVFTGYYLGSDFICLIDESSGSVVAKRPNIATSLL